MTIKDVKDGLRKYSSPERAKVMKRYFKTGKGDYAEGDVFLGLSVPQTRSIAKKWKNLPLSDIQALLKSKIHEERQTTLMILAMRASKADTHEKEKCFKLYMKNIKFINNWDLVDGSAPNTVGEYLFQNPSCTITFRGKIFSGTRVLEFLAESKNLWERRIAIIATFAFTKHNKFEPTIKISKILLSDKHDLIHKAAGWMLREVGKRDQKLLEIFLKKYYLQIPRTSLRYAIERFTEKKRKRCLLGIF